MQSDWSVTRVAFVYAVILVLAGVISLAISYYVVDDPAWLHRFGQLRDAGRKPILGFTIEVGRLAIIVPLVWVAIALSFSRTCKNLVRVWDADTWQWNSSVTWGRALLVALSVFIAVNHSTKCLDSSAKGQPAKLVAWGMEHGSYDLISPRVRQERFYSLEQRLESAQNAYCAYTVYSVVFWGGIVPVIVVVPVCGLICEDWHALKRVRSEFINRDRRTLSDFRRFRGQMLSFSTRYVRLLAAVGVAVAFEDYIGFLVMDPEIQGHITTALVFLVGLNALLLSVFGFVYYDCWQAVGRTAGSDGEADDRLASSLAPRRFIADLLRFDFSGLVVASLLVAPWKNELPFLSVLFGY